MFLVDIILILLLLGFAGAGAKDGFVHTLGRLLGAIIAFLAARAWSAKIAWIFAIVMPQGWARLIAFIVIFLFITRVAGWVFKLIDGLFEIVKILPFIKSIDKLLGAILGFGEGFIMLGGAIFLVTAYQLSPTLVTWATSSGVAKWIGSVFSKLLGVLL
ncbi:MAG: CvpA family protein [Patescibacteria group bacterium]|nr:CvpA family protein [Patescibacteria group bacterium]